MKSEPVTPGGADGTPLRARRAGRTMAVPFRVLAAEDHPINQVVLKSILAQAGVAVVIVDDGVAAVEAYGCAQWDLVLMDIQMPRMDGVNATRAIRQLESDLGRRRTPILAVTANVMEGQVASYLEAGMDGFVAKPIDIDDLVGSIRLYSHGNESRLTVGIRGDDGCEDGCAPSRGLAGGFDGPLALPVPDHVEGEASDERHVAGAVTAPEA